MIIYKIENKQNGMVYIGQTIRSLSERIGEHWRHRACSRLHYALRKYGIDSFSIEEIDCADSQDKLNELESFWVEYFDCVSPNGYNLMSGGGAKGAPSKETIEKMREVAKGRRHTEESKLKMGKSRLGNKNCVGRSYSEETLLKMSEIKKGIKMSDVAKEKLSKFNKGKQLSEEHKEKIRQARKTYWTKRKEIEK